MAYHPDTQAFYIPLNLSCEKGTFTSAERVEGGGGAGGGRRRNLTHPESPDGIGELLALSAKTGEILWRHRSRTAPTTATLTTGGGLVVVGDFDRYLYVHDAKDGLNRKCRFIPTHGRGDRHVAHDDTFRCVDVVRRRSGRDQPCAGSNLRTGPGRPRRMVAR
jgi:hypothetical protein